MGTFRIDRLNREFQRLIAEILSTSIKDDCAVKAIITNVDASRDLSHAKIYFTTIEKNELQAVLIALTKNKGKIRGLLGKMMKIRQIPELNFIYDDTESKARAMDELIDKVMASERGAERSNAEVSA